MAAQEMTPSELNVAMVALNWTAVRLAEWLGVNRATIARWRAGEQPVPTPVARLIRLLLHYNLAMTAKKHGYSRMAAEEFLLHAAMVFEPEVGFDKHALFRQPSP